ncbi:MAG: SRPBCC family protein [Hyphomicrobium sp.]
MLKKFILVMLGVVALFAAYVAMLPSAFSVERQATIAAPPAAVFAQVNDFHKWQDWSPWAKLDPNAKAIFEGAPTGEGAIFGWSGNGEVGEGRMTITESKPNERIAMRLDFAKPMQATNATLFTFAPEGEGTRVTWRMSGENNFIGRAVCLFMDMDKTVGGMFEKGLANLNGVVTAKP